MAPLSTALTSDHRRALVVLARDAARARVLRQALPSWTPMSLPPASGAFVTITSGGALRGCLGTLECRRRLDEEVARCAADAASEDPRFPPVSPDELDTLAFEVSVLGPLEAVDPHDPDAFTVGVHGLVVESGGRRGLLLPQVAVEWEWTPAEFLAHTCTKAGLARDAWRHGARVFRFAADVFGE